AQEQEPQEGAGEEHQQPLTRLSVVDLPESRPEERQQHGDRGVDDRVPGDQTTVLVVADHGLVVGVVAPWSVWLVEHERVLAELGPPRRRGRRRRRQRLDVLVEVGRWLLNWRFIANLGGAVLAAEPSGGPAQDRLLDDLARHLCSHWQDVEETPILVALELQNPVSDEIVEAGLGGL